MQIFGFASFGYEGSIVQVESDIRRGIPAVDIVGLADGAIKESRERMHAAICNSGFEFPSERVLISLSPADLKKEGAGFDLAMAISVLSNTENFVDESVLILGELELSGKVRGVRGIHAAVTTAMANGINHCVVPLSCIAEASIPGMKVLGVETLSNAVNGLKESSNFVKVKNETPENKDILFNTDNDEYLKDLKVSKSLLDAMVLSVAGGFHTCLIGAPGCGKTLVVTNLLPAIVPELSVEESQTVTRIYSIAGLTRPTENLITRTPFRMPHQTASIEGICGGGPNCRPGEISLAHNGILFLDEAAEFRSSVLQMLRVPMESRSITLSRAGRSTCYPAKFQLVMAVNPCPCGNYGSKNKICLCSAKSVEMYWKKFSDPLLDRVAIYYTFEEHEDENKITFNLEEIRERISRVVKISREVYGKKIQELSPYELSQLCNMTSEASDILDKFVVRKDCGCRRELQIMRLALCESLLNAHDEITREDIETAIGYSRLNGFAIAAA